MKTRLLSLLMAAITGIAATPVRAEMVIRGHISNAAKGLVALQYSVLSHRQEGKIISSSAPRPSDKDRLIPMQDQALQ